MSFLAAEENGRSSLLVLVTCVTVLAVIMGLVIYFKIIRPSQRARSAAHPNNPDVDYDNPAGTVEPQPTQYGVAVRRSNCGHHNRVDATTCKVCGEPTALQQPPPNGSYGSL